MDFEMWWLWFGLAALFLAGEIFTAGFFLFWFSIGSAVAGILDLMQFSNTVQMVSFILISVVLFLLSKRFADTVSDEQPSGIGANRLLGKEGVVLEEIDNDKNTGEVRIGQEEWKGTSETGEIISKDSLVKVERIDGTRVIVTLIQKGV